MTSLYIIIIIIVYYRFTIMSSSKFCVVKNVKAITKQNYTPFKL